MLMKLVEARPFGSPGDKPQLYFLFQSYVVRTGGSPSKAASQDYPPCPVQLLHRPTRGQQRFHMLPTANTQLTAAQLAAQSRTGGPAGAPPPRATPAANADPATAPPAKVVERTSNLYRAQMALNSVMQLDKSACKDYRLETTAADLLVDYR